VRILTKALIGMILTAASFAAASGTSAMAHQTYVDGAVSASPAEYPGATHLVQDKAESPYAMNYADEAAQTIGVRNGRLDVFSTKPAENQPYLPSLSGGVSGDGAMLKLQWHPGE
jgi:hypothetical protein